MPYSLLLLAAASVAIPADATALRAEVQAADDRFFTLFFDARCHQGEVRAMLTDDFEMYHDKAGQVASSADQFMADYAKACAEREKPDAWRSRRELVTTSLTVDPLPALGAIEDGDHRFYERRGDGPERLAGSAHFTQIWIKTEQGWRLSRVISFRHRAAP